MPKPVERKRTTDITEKGFRSGLAFKFDISVGGCQDVRRIYSVNGLAGLFYIISWGLSGNPLPTAGIPDLLIAEGIAIW